MSDEVPTCRWYQFSLPTLLMAILVMCVMLAGLVQLRRFWTQERELNFDNMQGVWRIEPSGLSGFRVREDVFLSGGFRGDPDGKFYVIKETRGVFKFEFDDSTSPKQMDWIRVADFQWGDLRYRWIYSLRGDTLTLCRFRDENKEGRPEAIPRGNKGDGLYVLVLTRVRP